MPYQLASACGLRTGWSRDDTLGRFRAMAGGDLPLVVNARGRRIRTACSWCADFSGCDALPFNPVPTTLPALLRVRLPG